MLNLFQMNDIVSFFFFFRFCCCFALAFISTENMKKKNGYEEPQCQEDICAMNILEGEYNQAKNCTVC